MMEARSQEDSHREEDKPAMIRIEAQGGAAAVYGRTGPQAVLAVALAAAVQTRKMVANVQGRPVVIPLDDSRLVSLIEAAYAANPHVIAEAVRALGGKDSPDGSHVLRLMRNKPNLAALARSVRFELDGHVEPEMEKAQ